MTTIAARVAYISSQFDIVNNCVRIIRASGDILNFQRAKPICKIFFSALKELEGAISLKCVVDSSFRLAQLIVERAKFTWKALAYRVSMVVLSLISAVDFVLRWCDSWSFISFKQFIDFVGSIEVFKVPVGAFVVTLLSKTFQTCYFYCSTIISLAEAGIDIFISGFQLETVARIITGSLRLFVRVAAWYTLEMQVIIAAASTIIISSISLTQQFMKKPPLEIVFIPPGNTRGHCCLSSIHRRCVHYEGNKISLSQLVKNCLLERQKLT